MLFSPVLASSHLRSASSPRLLRVLRDLCVKTHPPSASHHSARSRTSPEANQRTCGKLSKSARFSAKTKNPLLCFQQLAHSSAIRWGWGLPQRCHPEPARGFGERCEGSAFSPLPYLLSFHILPNSFAPHENATPLFSDVSKLFAKNTRVGGGSAFSFPCYLAASLLLFSRLRISPLTTRHSPLPLSPTNFPFPRTHAIVLTARGSF